MEALTMEQFEMLETQLADMNAQLTMAESERCFWSDVFVTDYWCDVKRKFEVLNEHDRDALEAAKGDEVKRLQAEIRARRELLAIMENKAGTDEVGRLSQDIENFKQANGFFGSIVGSAEIVDVIEPSDDEL
jgi:hypothetical protein